MEGKGHGPQGTAAPCALPEQQHPAVLPETQAVSLTPYSMGSQLQRSAVGLQAASSHQVLSICPRITSRDITNKTPLNAAPLGTGLTFPGASISEEQRICLAVTNQPERRFSSKPDDMVPA